MTWKISANENNCRHRFMIPIRLEAEKLTGEGGSMRKESMDALELLDEDEDFRRERLESDVRKRKKERRHKEKKYGGGEK
ncbi:hypothetical protein DITRI_Ditri04bG0086100 [Diplodiscus trichospermus]